LRKRLAEELDVARLRPDGTKLRQEDLAQIMGRDQTTVSRYVRGLSLPDLDALRKYEEHLGLPRGTFATRAGYVVPASTVVDAIEAAPELTDIERRGLLRAYRGAVDHARQRRAGRPVPTDDSADDGEVGL
jgi:transcriptional regulator with XRE-family HTH domain